MHDEPAEELPAGYEVTLKELERAEASVEQRSASLDSKVVTVLGASGILIGLVATRATVLSVPALVAALIAAVMAARGFLPRLEGALRVKSFRDRYLGRPAHVGAMVALDTRIKLVTDAEDRVRSKVAWLRRSLWALAASAGLIVAEVVWGLAKLHGVLAKCVS